MDEAANVVGGGAFLDFSIPSTWLDDLLDDDGDDDAPYSGGGVDSLLEAIDLSAATDKDVIGFVRANYERCKERNLCPPAPIDDAGRLTRPDPWELRRLWFITSKKFGSDEKTRRGFWKEKDNEFTAIRGDQWQQPAQRRPVYIGFKRTLEFYMNDGTKTEWLMNEFAMIHQSDDGHFFLKVRITGQFTTRTGKNQTSCSLQCQDTILISTLSCLLCLCLLTRRRRSSLARCSRKTETRTCALRCIRRIVPGKWPTATVRAGTPFTATLS